ncbi:MAG: YggT family protein [Chloroflexi bacterium]|jgi:YggT family protein|nr:MAG: YggT family protein [Chloroflexota bacterium]
MSTQAIINLIFETLWWVILGRVLMSWFDPSGSYRISRILYDMSEPILAPARRILPTFGGVDWSPLVTMIALNVLQNLIVSSL